MPLQFLRPAAAVLAVALLPAAALAERVSVRYDDQARPFPSNRLTVPDFSQATLRRVSLPLPDCGVRVSDCLDMAVINQLDGFSTQPRISVPFTGDIDVSTVNSQTVFLMNLGDTLTLRGHGERVGINQILWDPATRTLVFEPDALLAERSRYVLIVTNGVRDSRGKPLQVADFYEVRGPKKGMPFGLQAYPLELRGAVTSVHSRLRGKNVAAASLFTTQSSTGELLKIMRQIKASRPAPADFDIGSTAAGPVRAVFDLATLAGIQFNRQTGTAPSFTSSFLPTPALQVVPGSVAQVAYGRYRSPNYQGADQTIPVTPTLTGQPRALGNHDLVFQLFVPAGERPASGWPVVVFGHGFTDSMYGAPWTLASVMASRGLATLSINVVGHGGGAGGTLNVLPAAGLPVVVPAGGRGFDQDGNGVIDNTEGVNAAHPRTIVGSRDGLRQTVVDLMQLVRQIEVGMDVDGDGVADLDPRRIYYAGQSFGGIYGTILLGVEPNIRAGVPNVPGGSITELARLGGFRALTGLALALRQPPLLNLPPSAALPVPLNYNENMPLRDLPPVVNDVPGALGIAEVLDRFEWVQQSGNPASYASFIRKQPPTGHARKPVIVQVAKGDTTVPNPTSSALVRAGDLADRTTYYRHDLAYLLDPTLPRNPHTFLTNIAMPQAAPYAVGAQTQMAVFFASDGALVIDPDAAGPIFEVPMAGPLPEGLNFIP